MTRAKDKINSLGKGVISLISLGKHFSVLRAPGRGNRKAGRTWTCSRGDGGSSRMNESTGIRGRGVRDGEEARKEAVGPLNTLTPTPVYPQWGCWGA